MLVYNTIEADIIELEGIAFILNKVYILQIFYKNSNQFYVNLLVYKR